MIKQKRIQNYWRVPLIIFAVIHTTAAQQSTVIDHKGNKKVISSNRVTTTTATPTDAVMDDLWFDTNNSDNVITRVYDGTVWKDITQNGWKVNGNSGTNSSNNYLGTTDLQSVVIKSNNIKRLIVPATATNNSVVLFSNPGLFSGQASNTSAFLGIEPDNLGNSISRFRISAGKEDSRDDEQGASIDLNGNSTTEKAGVISLMAGKSASQSSTAIEFLTNSNGNNQLTAAVITGEGKFGIGTETPNSAFEVGVSSNHSGPIILGGNNLNNGVTGGSFSVVFGATNSATGDYTSITGGRNNSATERYSTILGGSDNTTSGEYSTVSGGRSNSAYSYGEWVGGLYSESYVPNSINGWNADDRLFVIGNGKNSGERHNAVTILKSGAVGIGVSSSNIISENMLTVNGNIVAVAQGTLQPDYVFESYFDKRSKYNPSYRMLSLDEIEAFIRKNKHLPGVQSRADIKKKQVWNISENVRTNLEKVEELYLYTILQEKKINAQKELLEQQELQIKSLQSSITEQNKVFRATLKRLKKLEKEVFNGGK